MKFSDRELTKYSYMLRESVIKDLMTKADDSGNKVSTAKPFKIIYPNKTVIRFVTYVSSRFKEGDIFRIGTIEDGLIEMYRCRKSGRGRRLVKDLGFSCYITLSELEDMIDKKQVEEFIL
jgi:hypothetical protein